MGFKPSGRQTGLNSDANDLIRDISQGAQDTANLVESGAQIYDTFAGNDASVNQGGGIPVDWSANVSTSSESGDTGPNYWIIGGVAAGVLVALYFANRK